MTDSLSDLLGKTNYSAPPEIEQIKDFVQSVIGERPTVKMTTANYIVSVPSAGAAASLQFKIYRLQQDIGPQRRIIIKIC